MLQKATTGRKFFNLITLSFLEPAVVCLWWNVFKLHSFFGLGTISYWNAMGISVILATIVGGVANAWYKTSYYARVYSLYHED